eukprot:s1595_g1.t1
MRPNSCSAQDRVAEFKAQELSILIYSCALLRLRQDPLLEATCLEARGRLNEFNPQNISNLVYGVGLLQFMNEPFLHDTCNFASERTGWILMAMFSAQGISNMTYALGLLGYPHLRFLRAVAGSFLLASRKEDGAWGGGHGSNWGKL